VPTQQQSSRIPSPHETAFCGYAHELYAQSLAEFGSPRSLPNCGGWVLERQIPGSPWHDAMGCYPLFACADFSRLAEDIHGLEHELVSIGIVADPFGDYSVADLNTCFERVKLFKQHYIVELGGNPPLAISKHHRYYARLSLRNVSVERCTTPLNHLDEWVDLYSQLTKRHQLRGMKRFSRRSFETMMQVPGMAMLRAMCGGRTVGAHLWFVDRGIGYSHLTALSAEGYALSASYALYSEAICRSAELLSPQVSVLNLGAGAGIGENARDGLKQFERGWATGSKPVYFCSRVLNPDAYASLMNLTGAADSEYFPVYRAHELV
jgi:hypothetical protein